MRRNVDYMHCVEVDHQPKGCVNGDRAFTHNNNACSRHFHCVLPAPICPPCGTCGAAQVMDAHQFFNKFIKFYWQAIVRLVN